MVKPVGKKGRFLYVIGDCNETQSVFIQIGDKILANLGFMSGSRLGRFLYAIANGDSNGSRAW